MVLDFESEISGSKAISAIKIADMFPKNAVVIPVPCLHHLSIHLNISCPLLKIYQ